MLNLKYLALSQRLKCEQSLIMQEIAYLEHQTVKNFLDCGHHVAFAMLIAHVIWYQY